MKKTLLLIGTVLLCLLIFVGMPYCMLKSSLLQNCNDQTTTCTKTIQHKLSRISKEHYSSRDSYIFTKVSTKYFIGDWIPNR